MWGDDPKDYMRRRFNDFSMRWEYDLPRAMYFACGCEALIKWIFEAASEHPVAAVVKAWVIPSPTRLQAIGPALEYQGLCNMPRQSQAATVAHYHNHDAAEMQAKIEYIQAELMRRYRTHVMGVKEDGPPTANPA